MKGYAKHTPKSSKAGHRFMNDETIHWADAIAEKVLERGKNIP
ncbi:hypothetical protein MNV_1740078 [Candidatus Methanoperedens nitroreducens]|uniref:Uncharacterized protein n=1 Tax=Candidatus Methanoperedens nitratireducens TaxID=1392998 RepID=A0A284VM99_9EURY|nr:hypothetical protein MNV_1740078 [Candidatus Methanoperedens nitroreducens]